MIRVWFVRLVNVARVLTWLLKRAPASGVGGLAVDLARALPVLLAAVAVLGVACASPAASPAVPAQRSAPAPAAAAQPPSRPAEPPSEWQALVRAAEQEGTVTIYGAPGQDWREFLSAAFSRAHPGIAVEYSGLGGSQAGARIVSEQTGGIFAADVFVGGVTTVNYTLLPEGTLVPIKDFLVLPEILDTSLWWQGRHWYGDEEGQYHFLFAPTVSKPIGYNTRVVNPDEIQSFRDVLDPKWRGKVVSWDPRQPGPSSQALRFFYHQPDLGPQFIRDFYSQTGVTVATDGRQIADWVARERYPLATWASSAELDAARDQGLPVDTLRRPLREGAWVSSSYGGAAIVKNAPHPNAAKLYVNWLLSRAGQTALQEIVQVNSARVDVPKDKLLAEGVVPQAGGNYVFIDMPQYVLDRQAEAELRRISRDLLEGR
jgi:iron(III) transport system substrate-binding protein